MTEKERNIELKWISKAKADRKDFGFLYEKYYQQIFIFIFKKVQNEEVAGEICSKTFLKAILNISKYEDRGFPFSSWLYRIASNEVNLFFRSIKKEITVEVNENRLRNLVDEINTEEEKEGKMTFVLRKLEELPPEKSQLIEMRFFEGLTFKEIGSIFAITEANAKMKVYRIIESINKQI